MLTSGMCTKIKGLLFFSLAKPCSELMSFSCSALHDAAEVGNAQLIKDLLQMARRDYATALEVRTLKSCPSEWRHVQYFLNILL